VERSCLDERGEITLSASSRRASRKCRGKTVAFNRPNATKREAVHPLRYDWLVEEGYNDWELHAYAVIDGEDDETASADESFDGRRAASSAVLIFDGPVVWSKRGTATKACPVNSKSRWRSVHMLSATELGRPEMSIRLILGRGEFSRPFLDVSRGST